MTQIKVMTLVVDPEQVNEGLLTARVSARLGDTNVSDAPQP